MMQHTSLPFTLAFGPQGCMAEVKGRVVAVWCHAAWPGLQRVLFRELTFLSLSLILSRKVNTTLFVSECFIYE
jgi:hypothetical protein